jgi:predicted GIY-YIG superfamily endonuclease
MQKSSPPFREACFLHCPLHGIRTSGRKANSEFIPSAAREILAGGVMKLWYVYIVGKSDGMYVGMTSDLQNRLRQHGWPALLFFEYFENKERALSREREIKGWSYRKKRDLIIMFSQQ